MTVINFKILVYYYLSQNKTNTAKTDNKLSKFKHILQDLIREDLLLLKNMIRLEAPIPTMGTVLVSVKRQSLSEHEEEGTDLLVVKALSIGYKRQNESRKSSR